MRFHFIRNFTSMTIALFWFAAIFDPVGNFFGLRYVALFLLGPCLLILFFNHKIIINKYSAQTILIIIYSILIPIYGIVIYIFRGEHGEFTDSSYIASGYLMLTSLLYFNKELCNFGIKSLILSLRLLSIMIIIMAITNIFLLENNWFSLFTESNIALISDRVYGDIKFPYIYFLSSPMLIYLLSHDFYCFLNTKNFINLSLFLISSIAIIATGTRSHILIGILFVPISLLIVNFKKYYLLAIAIITSLLLYFLSSSDINLTINEFFSSGETSNSIKISMLSAYGNIFVDPVTLLFGQGYNAHEWSISLRNIINLEDGATKTELTYLEIFRVFGLIFGSVIMCSLIYLSVASSKIYANNKWLYPALVIYLINASLNPYLFSTNGILPIALIIAIMRFNTPHE